MALWYHIGINFRAGVLNGNRRKHIYVTQVQYKLPATNSRTLLVTSSRISSDDDDENPFIDDSEIPGRIGKNVGGKTGLQEDEKMLESEEV